MAHRFVAVAIACGRCGLDTVVSANAGAPVGSRCPRCGSPAVELTDLTPERERVIGVYDALNRIVVDFWRSTPPATPGRAFTIRDATLAAR